MFFVFMQMITCIHQILIQPSWTSEKSGGSFLMGRYPNISLPSASPKCLLPQLFGGLLLCDLCQRLMLFFSVELLFIQRVQGLKRSLSNFNFIKLGILLSSRNLLPITHVCIEEGEKPMVLLPYMNWGNLKLFLRQCKLVEANNPQVNSENLFSFCSEALVCHLCLCLKRYSCVVYLSYGDNERVDKQFPQRVFILIHTRKTFLAAFITATQRLMKLS